MRLQLPHSIFLRENHGQPKRSLCVINKKRCGGTKSVQLATGCSSFLAAQTFLCLCRFRIHLTSPCSFRETVFHAKPSWRVSTPSCQDGSPWKLVLLFISRKKYNTILFYWTNTDIDTISLKCCTLKSLSTFRYKSVPYQYFWFYNHILLCSLLVLQ